MLRVLPTVAITARVPGTAIVISIISRSLLEHKNTHTQKEKNQNEERAIARIFISSSEDSVEEGASSKIQRFQIISKSESEQMNKISKSEQMGAS